MHDYSRRVTAASLSITLYLRVLLMCAMGVVLTACAVVPRDADRRLNGETTVARGNNKVGLLPSMSAYASGTAKLTLLDLQRELFTFVDRYMERVAQAADEGVAAASDSQARANLQATKVMYVSSAVAIASEPAPLNALRDLIVMVSLQCMVWEAGGGPQVDRREANRLAHALRLLELQILALAERFIPVNSIRTLQALILDWRRANPQQHYVAFVRFHDLGVSEGANAVDRVLSSGGLLAPVEAVAREAHEARLLAERGVYIANRMPFLLGWQGDLLYRRVVSSPEMREALYDARAYRSVLERLAREVENMPGRISAERVSAFRDLSERVAREREALFRQLGEGAHSYGPLVEQLRITATATSDVTAGLERLIAGKPGSEPFSMQQLHTTVQGMAVVATDLNRVVSGLDNLLGGKSDLRGLAAIETMLVAHERKLFFYAVALVFLMGVVLALAMRFGLSGIRQRDKAR